MNALAQMAQTLTRDHEDLPHRVVVASLDTPKRRAVRKAIDRTWRTQKELARLAGVGINTVYAVIGEMMRTEEIECLPGTCVKDPDRYRRAR